MYTLDENPSNRLNEHSQPMVKTYTVKSTGLKEEYVLYSTEFIVSWLRILLTFPGWRCQIDVPKTKKDKYGSVTVSTYETVKITCIRIPEKGEIEAQIPADQAAYHRSAARILAATLLKGDDLMYSNDVPMGELGDPARVASPANICKAARIEALGMMRMSLAGSEVNEWRDYHKSEKARLAYMANVTKSTRVPDQVLRQLTDSEAAEYNRQVIRDASRTMARVRIDEDVLRDADEIKNSGSKVNPALVSLYDTLGKTRAARDSNKGSNKDTYKSMVKKYYTLTGYRLDLSVEWKAKSYDLRMEDIAWAEALRKSDPSYKFLHYEPNDRIRAVNGVLPNEALVSTAKAKTVAPVRSSKMISTSKAPLTSSTMFSTFQPTRTVTQSSKVQEHMAKKTKAQESEEEEEYDDGYVDQGEASDSGAEGYEEGYFSDQGAEGSGLEDDGYHPSQSDDEEEQYYG